MRINETFRVELPLKLTEGKKGKKGKVAKLTPKIEIIHAGATRNHTFYPAEKLKGDPKLQSGLYSWTHPYPKPIIKNHDTDTEPLGRMGKVEFGKSVKNGKECLIAFPEITDPDAIQKLVDGRYMTVSIGADTDSATCNICGTNVVAEGLCGHQRGVKYNEDGDPDPNGTAAQWIVGNLWFNELSFVNVPADDNAMTVEVGEVTFMENVQEGGTEEMFIKEQLEAIKLGLTGVTESETPEAIEVEEEVVTPTETEPIAEEATESAIEPVEESAEASEEEVVEEATENPSVVEESEETLEVVEEEAPVAELEANLTTAEARIVELEGQLLEAVETSLGLTNQVEELQSRSANAEQENTTLLDENAQLQAELHRNLAERVVDLKISLGKPGVDDREAAIQQHVERATQSLQDALGDLLIEQKSTPVRAFVERVSNPAQAVDGEPNSTIVATENKPTDKSVSVEDALIGLFSGPKLRRN